MNAEGRGYRPALDGVRAVAVVGVLLYHAGLSWVTGGILGVDVFFVLSGYLITDLLLREWDRWGSIDLVTFYAHRARRLLPALCLVVAAVAVWAVTFGQSDRLGSYRADGIASLLYVANWRFVLSQQSYFDQFAEPSPFRHTWSLAIEEQYYLFFPLLLIGLLTLARGRRRGLVVGVTLAALAVLSAVEMVWLYHPGADPSRVYYGTDTRFFELMVGSVLAVVMLGRFARPAGAGSRQARTAEVAGLLALTGVVAMMYATTDQQPFLFRGGFVLLCLVTALLLWSIEVAPGSPVARLLSTAPFVYVGRISYGLYLWHWPVYVAISPAHTSLQPGTALTLVRLAVSFGLAVASYVLVEHPIRTGALRRMRPPRGRVVAALGLPVALGVLLAGTAGATAPPIESTSPFAPTSPQPGKTSLLVVGDSVGFSLADSFPSADHPTYQVQSSTELGCGLAVQYLVFGSHQGTPNSACDSQLERWRTAVSHARPKAVVLSLGAWEVFDHVVDGRVLSATSPEYAAYLRGRLETAGEILTADGAQLLIPTVPCYDQPSFRLNGIDDMAPYRNDPARARAINRVLHQYAQGKPGVTIVDAASWLCPDGHYTPSRDGVRIRDDGVHFTHAGGALFWNQVLMPAIEKRLAP